VIFQLAAFIDSVCRQDVVSYAALRDIFLLKANNRGVRVIKSRHCSSTGSQDNDSIATCLS